MKFDLEELYQEAKKAEAHKEERLHEQMAPFNKLGENAINRLNETSRLFAQATALNRKKEDDEALQEADRRAEKARQDYLDEFERNNGRKPNDSRDALRELSRRLIKE